MRPVIAVLLLFLVLSTPVLADAAPCSKPKVFVQNVYEHTHDLTANQTGDLSIAFVAYLKNQNPNLEIVSNQDISNFLESEKQRLLEGSGTDTGSQNTICSMVKAEYTVYLTIGSMESSYLVTSSLMDVDNTVVVKSASRNYIKTGSDGALLNIMQEQAKEMGDIAAIIEDYEKKHPVPPRDPSLQVQVSPETISPEDGKDTCNIKVQVSNCMGEPVEGTKVYFEENTLRGVVKGEKAGDDITYSDYQYAITDKDGFASATYKLDVSKGTKGGKDIVSIFTIGRGQKKASSAAEIEINGVYLEAFPEKNQIAPLQETDITVSLFELDSLGQRQPLSDFMLFIDKHGLSDDVRVIPLGPTDEHGNPITDKTGRVYLKFIAGKNEHAEMLKILFQDVGRGYPDAIIAWVEINVKKEEYGATISWKENGNWYHHVTGYYGEELDMDYSFSFNSRTNRDKYSGQETTDASFSYDDHEVITYGETGNFGRLTISSDISGKVNNYQTVNSVVHERFNSYYIPLTDFPVHIPISGAVTLEITDGSEFGYPAGGSISPTRVKPVTDIPLHIRSNADLYSLNWLAFNELRRLKYGIDNSFSYFHDDNIAEKCQLTQSGKDIYTSQWHSDDSVYYEGPPVFFGMLAYWETMEVEGSFSRDVSIKVVKK
jgi:hypothetical protein